jgi:hypothetical protein
MQTWNNEELEAIGQATELRISTLNKEGALRKPVIIWVVRVGDGLYIRAVKGPMGKWFKHAMESRQGHIDAGGISKDVNFVEADETLKSGIDSEYESKYQSYGPSIVGSILTPQAQLATIKLIPLEE